VSWLRRLRAFLVAAQERADQRRWDREQRRGRASPDMHGASEQMRRDLRVAEAWAERERERELRAL
jgi:hypothetical protein